MIPEFQQFKKIPRLSRPCIITEKLDGTNAQITITEDGQFLTGSRNRWITPEADNYGFAKWANEPARKAELIAKLGVGTHYGEWWGIGIQRGYDLSERRFSLFNIAKWADPAVRPSCCSLVPVLRRMVGFEERVILNVIQDLAEHGSLAAPGYMRPEGIVIYHQHGNLYFKRTLENDEQAKK